MARVGIRDHYCSSGVIFGPIPHLAFIARAGQESNLAASASRCYTHHYRPQCAGSCGDTRQRCLGHFYPPFFNTYRVEPQIGCVALI